MSFNRTGVLKYYNGESYFSHIGINPKFKKFYGVNEDEKIYDIEFEIHEEQNCPKDLNSIDYWGFLKSGEQEEDMRLIFPNYKQFSVCFPYGISVEEENKTGKSYRLRVKNFKEI